MPRRNEGMCKDNRSIIVHNTVVKVILGLTASTSPLESLGWKTVPIKKVLPLLYSATVF